MRAIPAWVDKVHDKDQVPQRYVRRIIIEYLFSVHDGCY